jgi:4a-hydroxytetrahydrobiopterin dehydratase
MADRKTLSAQEIDDALTHLNGWIVQAGKIHKDFTFPDFVHAFSFMAGVALVAEQMNHHPVWSNVYNRVVIDLYTHDVGGVTPRDVEFARRVDVLST